MHLKSIKLYKFLLTVIFIISLMSYEIHCYSYYAFFQIIISGLSIFLFMIVTKFDKDILKDIKKNITTNFFVIILLFLMLLNGLVSSVIWYFSSPVQNIKIILFMLNILSFFIMVPLLFKKYPEMKKYFENNVIIACIIISLLSVMIWLKGSFLGYGVTYGRISGIYSDPNFMAMVFSIGLLFAINNFKVNKKIYLFIIILILFAIFLTGSRGALIGLLTAIFLKFFFATKKKTIVKIIILICYVLICIYGLKYLTSVNFFRLSQGSNGRYEMIVSALDGVKKSQIFGYGYSSIETYLHNEGFNNASTHNSFVDFLFAFGLIPTLMYIILIVKNFYISLKYKINYNYLIILFFMVINMNTILYNLGGVGISSLLYTIIFGTINCENNTYQKKKR